LASILQRYVQTYSGTVFLIHCVIKAGESEKKLASIYTQAVWTLRPASYFNRQHSVAPNASHHIMPTCPSRV